MKQKTIKAKLLWSLMICLVVVIVSFLYLFLNKQYGFGIPCLFHEVTGFYCPGCGITRTIFALMQFHFVEAIHYNALVVILIPILGILFGIQYFEWLLNRTILKIPNWVWYLLVIVTLLFGVLRNIDYFSILQPFKI